MNQKMERGKKGMRDRVMKERRKDRKNEEKNKDRAEQ